MKGSRGVAGAHRTEFRLPDLGEGLTEAEILRWLVAPGDRVEVNDPLVEVETAKAAVEIPSPMAGLVERLGAEEGSVLAVGAPLLVFASDRQPERQPMLVGYGPRENAPGRRRGRRGVGLVPVQQDGGRALAKPPVRRLARDLGLDLSSITGSGPAGIVTRADVEHARQLRTPVPAARADADVRERIPVRSLRRATAEAMTRSAGIPQASVRLDVDVTALVELRNRLTGTAFRPGLTALLARAVVLALAERPMLHARWAETEIVVPAAVSLGVAVSTPRGLVVPKIRDAGRRSLAELHAEIARLAAAARAGELPPAELVDGTFTISNVGGFDVDGGTSLLPPGETGILCVGAVRERPWVVDGALAVRSVLALTLTIDHRVVDGEVAARFLADVGALLHQPGLMLARS
jgi:2-oxoisovalerate dehydrogenase E2 component (dihydrolipoyl transacylase)